MLTKFSPTDSLENEVNESQVSTLANAAKISHMINETTIGAFSHQQSKKPVETKMTSVQRQPSKDPWKRDVWHTVNLEMEKKRNCGSTINFMDCKAIQIKMALKNAERIRQKQVRLEMAQRHNKLNELDEMMQNLKIESYKKSATKLQKNLLFKEQEIVEVKMWHLFTPEEVHGINTNTANNRTFILFQESFWKPNHKTNCLYLFLRQMPN